MIENRVQDRKTGAKGTVLNGRDAEVAIVQFDDLPHPTWAEWRDLA